jgi:hypothetical protein
MDTRKTNELSARLEGVRRRFERWRESRKGRARIPDSLWASAALMAGQYGISRTADVLGVNSSRLKQRLGQKAAAASREEGKGEGRFVELTPFASPGSGECVVEWEDGDDRKMRIRLQGVGMPDLAALGRSFWDRQP